MNFEEQKAEELRLERTLCVVSELLSKGEDSYRRIQADLRGQLDDYWLSKTADFWDEAQRTEEVERQRGIVAAVSQRRRLYMKMLSTPYFGRIDLKEEGFGELEPIYIGIGTLSVEGSGEILVYDWRSPVASVFYDFELGKVWYTSPAGRVDGFVSLKRQYRIVDGRMVTMFDADVTINDEMLQEILGRSVNDKMRTIVTSIQRQQNQAIRDEHHHWLFVEGPAGSGKTSVALHRAAYWLYNRRNALTSKNILILSPNPVFSDYISNVLPELGEENVRRITFSDYIEHLRPEIPIALQSWTCQMEELLLPIDEDERLLRLSAIRLKSSTAFLTLLENYVAELEKEWVKDYPELSFRGELIWSREEWSQYFLAELTYLPVSRRLAKIRRLIQIRMRPMVKALRQVKAEEIADTGDEVNEKTILMLARLAAREALRPVVDEMERLTHHNVLSIYRDLYKTSGEREIPGTYSLDWKAICHHTLACFDRGEAPFEDVTALLYLYGLLQGFPEKKEIRHLIVDEGQDYSIMQYALLKRLLPRTAWTVLGDSDQAIHPSSLGASFEEAARTLGADDPGFIALTKSYRSTSEIQNFCRSLLKENAWVDAVERRGELPRVFQFCSEERMFEAVPSLLNKWQGEGWRSMAVICKTSLESKKVYQALAPRIALELIDEETAYFKRDIVVIPSYLAKGLEFDAVLVWQADAATYAYEEERKLFYMNCTRALHCLNLFYHGELTPFISAVHGSLYRIENREYAGIFAD